MESRLTGLRLIEVRRSEVGIGPVSLHIPSGRALALGGPSGSGKSLLLRMIADLDPHRGAVQLNDQGSAQVEPTDWRRRVALVPAESGWWSHRVGDHFDSSDPALLEALGFPEEVMTLSVDRLSSGERQRLALARALVLEPQALLLDEPTANLDPENVARVERLVLEYLKSTGAVAIWVTHDRLQATRLGSEYLWLEAGQLREAPHP